MKKMKLLLWELRFVSKKNLLVIMIYIVCATLSTASVLAFMSKFKDELTYLNELENYKRKYNIAFPKEDLGANAFDLDYVNNLFMKNNIPKVKNMILIEEEQFAYYVECEFETTLSDSELEKITALVKYKVLSLYDSRAESQAKEHKFLVAIILFLFLLVAFNTLNLSRYLIQKNSYRFTIYKACGSSSWYVFKLMYFAPVLITVVSYILGALLYKFFIFEFFYKLDRTLIFLSKDLTIIAFLANVLFCFILLLPSVISVLRNGVAK